MSAWHNGQLTPTSDMPTTDDNSRKSEKKDETTPSSASGASQQHNVQIPSVVLEDKESTFGAKDRQQVNPSDTSLLHQGDAIPNGPSLPNLEGGNDPESFFFWNHEKAKEKQVEQIGASACGATAVINVMVSLRHNMFNLRLCSVTL